MSPTANIILERGDNKSRSSSEVFEERRGGLDQCERERVRIRGKFNEELNVTLGEMES